MEPILPILKLNKHEKELRIPSKDVDPDKINSDEFQDFLDLLYRSMLNEKLKPGWMHAGISAVQIGRHINVFFAYNGNTDDYEAYINPEIEFLGDAQDVKSESCLSIPEAEGLVSRHKRIKIKYYNEFGSRVKKKYSGWNARVIQHEYDHLQGVLFIDKLVK
jgi:peptide deformylase